jgi:flavin-dependent dehydrogenase
MIHPYMTTEKIDVLVIGAGPSGTVAASIINKAGFKTKIVEKEQFPRFVIGESLLPRCMEALDAAGFVDVVKAKGFQVKYGAKFVQGTNKVMDFLFSEQFTKGWSWTWQVKRADFDYALAKEVERMGVPVEYKTTVTNIQFSGSNSVTSVTKEDGTQKQIEAKFIVDASGYGRVIPRLFNLDKPSNLPPRKTLFTHIKDARRENYIQPNRILIIDHAPGVWAWVIPFSDGVSSCGFVGYPEYFDKYIGSPEEQLRAIIKAEPNTAKRFEDCEFMFEPRTIQGWSSTTNKFYGDGFVLTGNVTEFLDPIFSSGVTLATVSSHRAAELAVRQLKGETIDWEEEYMKPTMVGVDTFRTFVMAWYDGTLQKIFFNDVQNIEVQRQICSVLAGYVWDTENPYVKNHESALKRLARLVEIEKILSE